MVSMSQSRCQSQAAHINRFNGETSFVTQYPASASGAVMRGKHLSPVKPAKAPVRTLLPNRPWFIRLRPTNTITNIAQIHQYTLTMSPARAVLNEVRPRQQSIGVRERKGESSAVKQRVCQYEHRGPIIRGLMLVGTSISVIPSVTAT